MKERKTEMMRVPAIFKDRVGILSSKYGFKSRTEFLEKNCLPILDNADYLNDIVNVFVRRRKKRYEK